MKGDPMFDLDHIFKYHAPTPETLKAYTAIREGAKAFAALLVENTPEGADQAAALRLIREASMTANAAVALGGRLDLPPIVEVEFVGAISASVKAWDRREPSPVDAGR
jgi:hypothetical protein